MFPSIYEQHVPKYPFKRYSTKQLLAWFDDCNLQYSLLCQQQKMYPSESTFFQSMVKPKSVVLRMLIEVHQILLARGIDAGYLSNCRDKTWEDVHGNE